MILEVLYEYQILSEEQINIAIEKGKGLAYLYDNENIKFTPENINNAIEKGKYFYWLYSNEDIKFTPENINNAIEKGGEEISWLYMFHKNDMTPEQIKRIKRLLK